MCRLVRYLLLSQSSNARSSSYSTPVCRPRSIQYWVRVGGIRTRITRRAIMLSRSPVQAFASGLTNGATLVSRVSAGAPESEADWLPATSNGAAGSEDGVESRETVDRPVSVPGEP